MTLNAFATGTPGNAVIGITEGLLRRLSLRELAGVLAHELSHVRNNDLSVMSLADVMTRFTQALSYLAVILAIFNLPAWLLGDSDMPFSALLLLYLAPTIGSLLQLGLSRTREYDADLEGAELTGDPRGLASALDKLERYQGRFWEDLMFPVPSRRIPQPSLLRSHPPTEQRVARLLALENREMAPPIEVVEEPMVSHGRHGPRLHAAALPLSRRLVLTSLLSRHFAPSGCPGPAARRGRACAQALSRDPLGLAAGCGPCAPLGLARLPPASWLPPAWPATRSAGCAAPFCGRTSQTGSACARSRPCGAGSWRNRGKPLLSLGRVRSRLCRATRRIRIFSPSAGTREVGEVEGAGAVATASDRSKRRLPPPPLQFLA